MYQVGPITSQFQSWTKELFATISVQNIYEFLPLDLLLVQREQTNLSNRHYKLSTYIKGYISSYSQKDIDNTKIIFYGRNI